MTVYNPTSTIILESLEILQDICQWTSNHESQDSANFPVLVGGWAVHVYNPWFGSLDIDLVTSSKTRHSLKWYLKNEKGFFDYRLPYATSGSTVSTLSSEGQHIIIDFATYESKQPFEGSKMVLPFEILQGNTELRLVGNDVHIRVPNRSILLILKLKAAWDRHFRIMNKTSHDQEWEQGKLLKDYGDILALLDPKKGGREVMIEILGDNLTRYNFLKECFLRLLSTDEPFDFYGRMTPETGKKVIADLLEMVT